MKGTEKQIKWAEDIKKQVREAAAEWYEGSDEKKILNLEFGKTYIGMIVEHAEEHMDSAKYWIDAIGYDLVDAYDKVTKREILNDMADHFYGYEDEAIVEAFIEAKNTAKHEAVVAKWEIIKAQKAAKKAARKAAKEAVK